MTSHEDFQRMMRADPHDEHTRLVYADWLEEQGLHGQARRMRWWVGAMRHLRAADGAHVRNRGGQPAIDIERTLPNWAHRLLMAHGVNYGLEQANPNWKAGHVIRNAAHTAELRALGLLADPNNRAKHLPEIHTLPAQEHEVARNLVRGNTLDSPFHPVRDLAEIVGTHAWAHHSNNMNHLREYLKQNPPDRTEEEVLQLARPLGWIKDKVAGWLGKTPPPRDGRDGIVHTHANNPTAAYAEKNAVAQALRLLGAPDHMKRVDRYTAHVARFVNENPQHAVVRAYKDKASVIGGTAGPELTDAVKPLVGVVNLLLAAHGLDERFKKPETESRRAAFEHATSTAPEETPQPPVADGPLEAPVEHATEENMHNVVHRLLQAHAGDLNKTKEKLKREHGLSHQEAHEATRAFLALHTGMKGLAKFKREVKRNPDAKLAKPKPGADVEPEHVLGVAYDRVPINEALAGTSLAFHLRQIGQDHPDLAPLVDRALARQSTPDRAGGDAFARIGVRLKQKKDARADIFNWHTMHDSLIQDAKVKAIVERHVKRTETGLAADRRYWDAVHRGFGQGKAGNAADFWARMERHGEGLTREQITASIARLKDRALDREYAETVKAEGKRGRSAEPKDHPLHWRGVLGAVPSEEHAKYAR